MLPNVGDWVRDKAFGSWAKVYSVDELPSGSFKIMARYPNGKTVDWQDNEADIWNYLIVRPASEGNPNTSRFHKFGKGGRRDKDRRRKTKKRKAARKSKQKSLYSRFLAWLKRTHPRMKRTSPQAKRLWVKFKAKHTPAKKRTGKGRRTKARSKNWQHYMKKALGLLMKRAKKDPVVEAWVTKAPNGHHLYIVRRRGGERLVGTFENWGDLRATLGRLGYDGPIRQKQRIDLDPSNDPNRRSRKRLERQNRAYNTSDRLSEKDAIAAFKRDRRSGYSVPTWQKKVSQGGGWGRTADGKWIYLTRHSPAGRYPFWIVTATGGRDSAPFHL